MSSLSKWILALVIALSLVVIVQASQQQESYLPIVYRQAALTPTRTGTATRTPTVTTTPTRTPTITKTPTPLVGLRISNIVYAPPDPWNEYAEIRNTDSRTAQLKGAILADESGNKYTFPTFSLKPGATVRVWSKAGKNEGNNLYWGSKTLIWNDIQDCAYLRDVMKNKLDQFCYSQGQFYRP